MYNELCPQLLYEPVGNIGIALAGRARWPSAAVLKPGPWFVEPRYCAVMDYHSVVLQESIKVYHVSANR